MEWDRRSSATSRSISRRNPSSSSAARRALAGRGSSTANRGQSPTASRSVMPRRTPRSAASAVTSATRRPLSSASATARPRSPGCSPSRCSSASAGTVRHAYTSHPRTRQSSTLVLQPREAWRSASAGDIEGARPTAGGHRRTLLLLTWLNQALVMLTAWHRLRGRPFALVAQWIEHRPPEPGAQVRVLPRVPFLLLSPGRSSSTKLANRALV